MCDGALVYKHRTYEASVAKPAVSFQTGTWSAFGAEEVDTIQNLRVPAHLRMRSDRPLYLYTDGRGYTAGSGVGVYDVGHVHFPLLVHDYSITTRRSVAPSNHTFETASP